MMNQEFITRVEEVIVQKVDELLSKRIPDDTRIPVAGLEAEIAKKKTPRSVQSPEEYITFKDLKKIIFNLARAFWLAYFSDRPSPNNGRTPRESLNDAPYRPNNSPPPRNDPDPYDPVVEVLSTPTGTPRKFPEPEDLSADDMPNCIWEMLRQIYPDQNTAYQLKKLTTWTTKDGEVKEGAKNLNVLKRYSPASLTVNYSKCLKLYKKSLKEKK